MGTLVNLPKMMGRLKQELFVTACKGEADFAVRINDKHKDALNELKKLSKPVADLDVFKKVAHLLEPIRKDLILYLENEYCFDEHLIDVPLKFLNVIQSTAC